MDRLAKVNRELYFADSMQPIEMGKHIPGLWLSGWLSKPGEHDRAQIFPRQQQGIQLGAAAPVERFGQPLIEQLYATGERLGAQAVDHGDRGNNDTLAA